MKKLLIVLSTALMMAMLPGARLVAQSVSDMPPIEDEPKVADARDDQLRVMATGAIRAPLLGVIVEGEAAIDRSIFVEIGSARGNLRSEILGGQEFEVALLITDVNNELLEAGEIRRERVILAEVPVGLSIRGDVPDGDISTPEKVKALLLGAASVKYSPTGAALGTVRKMMRVLGLDHAINDTSALQGVFQLRDGEYEVGIFPVSEILNATSTHYLGEVPQCLQAPLVIEAVIGTNARYPREAEDFLNFLRGPEIDQGLAESGLRRPD